MVKRNISIEALGITFAEYGALLGTRELLRSGELKHAEGFRKASKIGNKHLFNMSVSFQTSKECGSVACIGGTMAQIMNDPEPNNYVMNHDPYNVFGRFRFRPISFLFFPPNIHREKITAKLAIKAIDNFLRHGQPMWDKILKKKKLWSSKKGELHVP